jgi:hypothetical protein
MKNNLIKLICLVLLTSCGGGGGGGEANPSLSITTIKNNTATSTGGAFITAF